MASTFFSSVGSAFDSTSMLLLGPQTGSLGLAPSMSLERLEKKRRNLVQSVRSTSLSVGARRSSAAQIGPVKREKLLEDSLERVAALSSQTLLEARGKVSVRFDDEPGYGQGVTRDWFTAVAGELSIGADRDPNGKGLFALAADSTMMPRPCIDKEGDVGKRRLRNHFAVGRLLALAVVNGIPVPVAMNNALYKFMLKQKISSEDVRSIDPEFYRNRLQYVVQPGGVALAEAALCDSLFFMSAPTELRGAPRPLVENGSSLRVTEENKAQYIELLSEDFLCGDIRRELASLLCGFWDLLSCARLRASGVTCRDLALLVAGLAELDVAEWRSYTQVRVRVRTGSKDGNIVVEWLWETLQEMDSEYRAKVLHFATGSSRLPPGGFVSLSPAFAVEVDLDLPIESLPVAHTCFNMLVLPLYRSRTLLRSKLELAVDTAVELAIV